jgi:hypothetical protein
MMLVHMSKMALELYNLSYGFLEQGMDAATQYTPARFVSFALPACHSSCESMIPEMSSASVQDLSSDPVIYEEMASAMCWPNQHIVHCLISIIPHHSLRHLCPWTRLSCPPAWPSRCLGRKSRSRPCHPPKQSLSAESISPVQGRRKCRINKRECEEGGSPSAD